jgi:hypothetical protein
MHAIFTHSQSLATCRMQARSVGVKRQMRGKEARKFCPNIVLVQVLTCACFVFSLFVFLLACLAVLTQFLPSNLHYQCINKTWHMHARTQDRCLHVCLNECTSILVYIHMYLCIFMYYIMPFTMLYIKHKHDYYIHAHLLNGDTWFLDTSRLLNTSYWWCRFQWSTPNQT